jgi:RNA polymerase sigma-70 factor, ECF subfamily
MSTKLNDHYLLASSLAGDEEAFGKLYDKYVDDIYKFIKMRVRQQEQAQDLVSDTFLKTWQYVSGGKKQITDFRALLYRVARNLVIDFYRASQRADVNIFDEEQLLSIIDYSQDIGLHVQAKDEVRQLFEHINELTREEQELILMRYVQELSIKEIAHILGKNHGAVRVALHRAKRKLTNKASSR